MSRALEAAKEAAARGEVPVGAVIVHGPTDEVLSVASNRVLEFKDPTAHAELLAIREACKKNKSERLVDCDLYVTLEPCPMCAWAIRSSGIGKLIFGAYNPQYGAAGSVYDLLRDTRHGRRVEVIGGVLEEECQRLLGGAFDEIRDNYIR